MERRPHPRQRILILIAALALFMLLFTVPVFADDATPSMISDFLTEFENISKDLEDGFLSVARTLFWALAFIQFAWAAITLGRRGDFSFNSLIELLIREIMYIGFFYMLLEWPNIGGLGDGSHIGGTIVEGFRKIGADVTGFKAITPSSVLRQGSRLSWKILSDSFGWNVGKTLAALFPSAVVLLSFAFAAAHTAVMMIEYYVIAPVGVLMLGFGGSLWTKNYAETYLRCLVSVGIKLVCLQVILAFSLKYLDLLLNSSPMDATGEMGFFQSAFMLAGLSIVIYMAVQQIPGWAAGLISGSSSGSGSALTAAAGATLGAAASKMMGAGKMIGAGMGAANDLKDAGGSGGGSSDGGSGIMAASQVSSGGSSGGSSAGGSSSGGGESSGKPSLPSALSSSAGSSSAGSSSAAGSSAGGSSAGSSSAAGSSEAGGSAESGAATGDSSEGGGSGFSGGGEEPSALSPDSGGETAGGSSSDGGDSAPPAGSESSPTSSNTNNTPPAPPSISKAGFIAKAMIRQGLGLNPISKGMTRQLNQLKAHSSLDMSNKQSGMYNAMFNPSSNSSGGMGQTPNSGNAMLPGSSG